MARTERVEADDVEEPQEPSLRETIELARDEVIDEQVKERESEAGAAGADASGPVRDDSGRFTRRAPQDNAGDIAQRAPAEAQEPAGAKTQIASSSPADGAGAAQPLPQGAPAEIAPQGWTPAAKAAWPKLAPEIRSEITRRETEMHRALSRQDEERQYGRSFAEIAQANQDVIARSGVAPQRIFQDFLGIMKTLAGNDPAQKAALLRDVAIRNGLDLRTLVGMPSPGQNPNSPQPANPDGPSMQRDPLLLQIANEFAEQKARAAREAQEKEQREQQDALDAIIAFRAQPDAPYFDAVKDQMVALLQAGAAATLKEAYEQATWARPDIRAQLLEREQKAATLAAEKRRRAELARQKGGSVSGGAGSAASSGPAERTLREELSANFAESRSRV